MDSHNDALGKPRDCPPRSSEPSVPGDPWPEGYETLVITDEELAKQNEVEAKEAYDTFIQMGGRPIGPI